MKRISIVASEASYENLRTFETIDQLNETVREYKRLFVAELKPTEVAVLNLLHRYSAKYTGVSFLRKGKIAELIGKSRRTVIRVCNRLEALGIIRQYEIARPTDKRQTSNAIVIVPIEQPVEQTETRVAISADVTPEATGNVTPNKTTSSLKQLHNNTKERTAKPAWIPQAFYDLLSAHFGAKEDIEEYWRAVYATTYRMDFGREQREEIGIVAFMEMKARRKRLRKPVAYFVGVVKRMAKREYVNGLFNIVFNA
ncbi:helix-turn-helix domain-containing protein [Bacillus sp. ISL-37]|uniref:helix-turn-helix domain-containing protein n=1 Tax=Bacillus sp. ISL-37 TaxID=2819123 RepID=UPI001BE6960E|nr:helix-turn-helix domain-containing protein [Bacillus sp. ISL-37]MBT2682628.1 helix-turn-helix domain-containing protein [Bacillus sp. ISL-37]